MNWKFWEKKNIQIKQAALGTSEALGSFLIFGTEGNAATPASSLSLYGKSTAVSIPINLIAESFASIEPVINMNGKIITKHPVLDLLAKPSPYFTQDLFLEALAKDYLITGETELIALGSVNRPPLELQPISPRNVSVIEGNGGLVNLFTVSGNTLAGSYSAIKVKKDVRYLNGGLLELKQIRNYSTTDNSLLRGESLLRSAAAEVRQHIQGNNHNVSLLENGGKVSLIFHFDEDLNADEFKETKNRVIAQYGGPQNAGKVGVTSGGKLDIKEAGISNRDMDFANLQQMAQRSVALQYKVPLPLVTTDAATFNNYVEAKLALYDDAVLPLADRLFAGLTDMLMPRYGMDPTKAKITYDPDQITALEKRRNENLKLRKDLNLESVNELREGIGKEAVEGGDDIMVASSLVPLGTKLFDEPPPVPNEEELALARDKPKPDEEVEEE